MKGNMKKLVAFILAVCLLVSVTPGTAAAAGTVTTYDLNLAGNKLVNSATTVANALTVINNRYATAGWKWEGTDLTNNDALKFYNAGLCMLGGVSNYMAIRIKAPGTGVYTLGLNYATSPYSGTVAVYVLPGDTTYIKGAMNLESRVGKLSLWEARQDAKADYLTEYGTGEAYVGTCELTANQEYIVVFEGCEASAYYATRCYLGIDKLTLTAGDVFVETEAPAVVTPMLVNDAPVTLLEGCQLGTTLQLDGKDYMFEPVEGKKLLAFDMDSHTRAYEADVPFLVTRGIAPDDSGNLWLCGDNNMLYRFDPEACVGQATKSFADVDPGANNGFDMLYVNGCVYFGTSPTGSIVKYDIAADTFTRIYNHGGTYVTGLVHKDGYLYATVYDVRDSANESWAVVKINLENTADVTSVDVSSKMNHGQMFYDAGLAGNLLLLGGGAQQTSLIAIDTNTMQLVELGAPSGIFGSITEEVNGKVYFVLNGSYGLCSLDVQTRQLEYTLIKTVRGLRCGERSIIQVDDANYPGNNIALYAPANGEPMLYNLEKNTIKRGLDLIEDYGTATYIRAMTNGAAGSGDIYIGAFNVTTCATYNTDTKAFSKFATLGQTDALCYYNGELFAGNYTQGAIVRVDLADSKNNQSLLTLNDDTYDQARIHTLTAGDGKIFAGSTPDKGAYGGCLAWVDLQTGQTYAERNVVQDQTVNCVVYHDGLIYGTTSIYGGTGSTKRTDLSAKLFVYDVAAKQKLAEFDLREYLEGFTGNIEFISGIAADPNVDGRFWGLVSETLFSFTYDKDSGKLTVKEELSYRKNTYDIGSSKNWFPKPFCFDGAGNLYLSFDMYGGMRRINTNNTADNERLTMPNVMYYTLGEDGNLYYGINEALYMFPLNTADEEWTAAAAVDQLIDSIGTPVTLESAAAVKAARAAYDGLDMENQALVQKLDVLEEAEAVLLNLQIQTLPQTAPVLYKAQTAALLAAFQAMNEQQKAYVTESAALIQAYSDIYDKYYLVGDGFYGSFADAAAQALSDGSLKVTLIDNAQEEEVLITSGITLDLNGYTMDVDAFRSYVSQEMYGFVVDSSEGNNGFIHTASGADLFNPGNPDLPLYDQAAGGYRFFDYTLELYPSAEKAGTGKQKFWFKFHFLTDDGSTQLDQDAYDLIQAGGTGFEISVRTTWKDRQLPRVYFGKNGSIDAFSQAWATGATQSRWLYVVVSGLSDIGFGKLTVEPVLSVGNVEVTGGVITYEKKIEGTGGWSDIGPT